MKEEIALKKIQLGEGVTQEFKRCGGKIEKDKMFTENACIPQYPGEITPENLDPRPRNPLIAKVFREIHFSDQLGSGMRKLYHDVPLYSGFAKPQFLDGNVFRLIVPLNDEVPSASEMYGEIVHDETAQDTRVESSQESSQKIIELIKSDGNITTQEMAVKLGISRRAVAKQIARLQDENIIPHVGPTKNGHWEIILDGEELKGDV